MQQNNNVAYVARVKDIPYGARVRYVGQGRVYTLIDKGGNGTIAEWSEEMPRAWKGQGIWSITEHGNCLDLEMEVLRA